MESNEEFNNMMVEQYQERRRVKKLVRDYYTDELLTQEDAVGGIRRITINGDGTSRPSAMAQKSVEELKAIITAAPSQLSPGWGWIPRSSRS